MVLVLTVWFGDPQTPQDCFMELSGQSCFLETILRSSAFTALTFALVVKVLRSIQRSKLGH